MQITSLDNKLIKYAAALKDKKYRDKNGEFLAEGFRNVADLLQCDALSVKNVFITEKHKDRLDAAALSASVPDWFFSERVHIVSETVMAKLCDTSAPQEIVAVAAKKREFDLDGIIGGGDGRFIYLDKIRDPGNLGSVLRTAAAAGYRVILDGCADIYSPKVVRAGMGAALKADFVHAGEDALVGLKNNGYLILAADMDGENMFDFKPVSKVCIVIGGEADGISPSVLEKCDKVVSIPMQSIESLNAAAAAAVLMYYFLRPKE